jgi:hypothetical protein
VTVKSAIRFFVFYWFELEGFRMVEKFPVWVSRSSVSKTELIHCVGVFSDPEEALERVGEIISALGAKALVIKPYRGSPEPVEGLSEGVEAYDPSIPLRFVVFGLELSDAQEEHPPMPMMPRGSWGPQKVILS